MLTQEIAEETSFIVEREFTATPLARKGLNKHYINLVTADVFTPQKTGFFSMIKELFKTIK